MTITLLKNEELNKYKAIWTKDKQRLQSLLWNEKYFKCYGDEDSVIKFPRWRIVDSKKEVKQILKDNFASKGRGGDYQEGLPSGTVITSSLFPVNLTTELFKLTWANNTSIEDIIKQEEYNKGSLSLGTFIHKCLEIYLLDDSPLSKKNIDYILSVAQYDKEILWKIKDFEENRMEYEHAARQTLVPFFEKELCKYTCVGSEVFFNNGDIQGSVDLVAKRNGIYYILDFKTTRKVHKQSGNPKFSYDNDLDDYKRQLLLYWMELVKCGTIPLHEANNVKFVIIQFHLLSFKYKLFEIKLEDIIHWKEDIEVVKQWYWENME